MQLPIPASHRLVLSLVCLCVLQVPTTQASWFGLLPSEMPEISIESWKPLEGDSMVVDTSTNIGYLVHADGGFTSFDVVTGQKRVVSYIGRTYNAATPNRHWTVLSDEKKGRSVTFGEDGTFLRLYDDGERTAYGIHSHLSIEVMLAEDYRYRSMGCILVSEAMLDVIEETFLINKEILHIVTVNGFENETVNYALLKEKLQENTQS